MKAEVGTAVQRLFCGRKVIRIYKVDLVSIRVRSNSKKCSKTINYMEKGRLPRYTFFYGREVTVIQVWTRSHDGTESPTTHVPRRLSAFQGYSTQGSLMEKRNTDKEKNVCTFSPRFATLYFTLASFGVQVEPTSVFHPPGQLHFHFNNCRSDCCSSPSAITENN